MGVVVDLTRAPAWEVEAEDGFVEFWRARALVSGRFACVSCGYGVAVSHRLPTCPSCGGEFWELITTSPFASLGLGTPETQAEHALDFARGALLAVALGGVLWVLLGALAFGLVALSQR